jgi:flagellin
MSFRINTNVSAMNAMRNLSQTGMMLANSVTRLSTGLRINNAGDDPSGLIASEKFRAQIAGMDQALKNNQDALNYAKTAEGALDEVNKLLRDARALAVAYSGSLDSSQLVANQDQLNSILASIDRIASNTQFGTKKLLNGSSGVQATVVDGTDLKSIYLGGTVGTQSITADGSVNVQVTTAATQAAHTGTNTVATADLATYLATAVGTDGSFAINGISINVASTDTWGDVVNKINDLSGQTGVRAEGSHDGTNGVIQLTQNNYGAAFKINLTDSAGIIQAAAGSATAAGVNAVASVTVGALNAVTFTGGQNGNNGLTLTDSAGNRVVLTETGNAVATYTGAAAVTAGSASFQIGAFAGQTTSLSLSSVSSASLSLSSLDVTSGSGATSAQSAIDTAIDTVSRMRGNIGSFMRNTLESNIRSLGVAKENLTATESSIRDVDIADEMATFTKLQILQQSGLAVLAQANSAPQSVLGLLR